MLNNFPKVSIVTITYHNAQVTCAFLDSLKHITYPNIEIFVVDNGPDEESAMLKERYPHINYMPAASNLGFGGGNNLAIKETTGDFVLLINNDTEVTPGFLEPVLQVFKDHPDAGVVSSKLVYFNTDKIQYAGDTGLHKYTGRSTRIGLMAKDDGSYNKVYKTQVSHGAAMTISRLALEKVGGLAERYFLYFEEIDYCEKTRRAGFKIYYCGLSTVYHKESTSIGKHNPLKTYLMTRNRFIFIRKFYRGKELIIATLFYYFFAIPKNLMVQLLRGRFDNSNAIFSAAIYPFAFSSSKWAKKRDL